MTQAEDCLRARVSELSRRLAATLAERRQVAPGGGGEESLDLLCNSLYQTISVDGGSALKLAIADALHGLCREWSDLDERLKASAPGSLEPDLSLQSALNLDNDESASWFLFEGSRFAWFLNEITAFIGSVRVDVMTPVVTENQQVRQGARPSCNCQRIVLVLAMQNGMRLVRGQQPLRLCFFAAFLTRVFTVECPRGDVFIF